MTAKSPSPKTTQQIAALLAHQSLKYKSKDGALVFALTGDLGSGKTTFIQGFARGLSIKRRLPSPTFLIIRRYKLPLTNYQFLFHIDCYRLKKPKELEVLGLQEIFGDPKNIVLIEWADKIKKLLPKRAIWINFKHGGKENERTMLFGVRPPLRSDFPNISAQGGSASGGDGIRVGSPTSQY